MRHPARTALFALAALLAVAAVPASLVRAEDAEDSGDAAVQQPAEETAKALFERLEKAVNESRNAAIAAYKAAVEKEQKAAEAEGRAAVMPAYDMAAGMAAHIAEFQSAAARFAGTDDAVQFLTWLAMAARTDEAGKAALGTLLSEHLRSGAITRLVSMLPFVGRDLGPARVRSVLDSIIADNPHPDVQAQALITRSASRRSADPAAARADVERAAGLAEDAKIVARAKGILTELDHLQIGSVAPEIEGADLDGVAFKLSDYRGKVVVIDFWGDW